MVPAHVEQECNANDAEREGIGIIDAQFSLDRLLDFAHQYEEDVEFRMWENQAEQKFMAILEGIYEQTTVSGLAPHAGGLSIDMMLR